MNNIIIMNRGDTYEFDLTVCDDASPSGRYRLSGEDAIYFGIMDPHQPFEHALVKKKFTVGDVDEEGNLTVVISPDDTLDLIPGKYFYSVKLKIDHLDEDGNQIEKVFTVINKTKLILCD